jgi:hypothetical protein
MLKGSCHCGIITWTYDLPLESVTACNCTLCSRYGALWAYGWLDRGITVSGNSSKYQRNRKLSSFNFCGNCGCLTHYLLNSADEQGRRKIAVNMRMVSDPSQVLDLPIDHFEGREKFEDLPRDGRCVRDLWF